MRKQIQIQILILLSLATTACLGQTALVNGIEQPAGHGGLPVPFLEIAASESTYLVTTQEAFVFAPILLALSDTKGEGVIDLGLLGVLPVPVAMPLTTLMGFADVHGQHQLLLPKPPAGALPPALEDYPLLAIAISVGVVVHPDRDPGYTTYVISSSSTRFLLASASE